jgi:hypothetical protein
MLFSFDSCSSSIGISIGEVSSIFGIPSLFHGPIFEYKQPFSVHLHDPPRKSGRESSDI